MSESSLDQAQKNWTKATDALFELNDKVKTEGLGDQGKALITLCHVVSYLVAAVGALIVNEQGKELE